MTDPLYRIGQFCVRHRFAVLALWVGVAVTVSVVASNMSHQLDDDVSLPGAESQRSKDVLEERFPDAAVPASPILVRAREGTLRDHDEAISETRASLARAPHVAEVASPLAPGGSLSRDGTVGFFNVTPDLDTGELDQEMAEAIVRAAEPARAAGLQVEIGGWLGKEVSTPETRSSELVGLSVAILVLLLTFGTVNSMILPILTAILTLVTGLALIRMLGHAIPVPSLAPTLATMIGLGVAIDYALFLVTRHREQRAAGMAIDESIARAVATSGGAVVFAGGTVAIAICSLVVTEIPLVTAIAYTSALVVVLSVVAAITLLPAVLAVLGRAIDGLPLPWRPDGRADRSQAQWARWARGVTRRPWLAVLLSLALLVPLSVPALSLELGQADTAALTDEQTVRRAYDLMAENVVPGANGPLVIAVELHKPVDSADDPPLAGLREAVAGTTGVDSASPLELNDDGTAAAFTATPTSHPADEATEDVVRRLREVTLPEELGGTGAHASVGGLTAAFVDLADRVGDKLTLVIGVVVGLSFLLLMLAFRSVAIPLKAGLMNLISVTAAYGVLVAVFQWGWGAELIGLDGEVPIVSYVPLMMFAVLFGLSMDYEVFLLSHVQERYRLSGDNTAAVIRGLAISGRVITSAALIMVCVFASFILNGDPTVKQFGVGLAVAIAIDATVVRCLLVPSLMVLMAGVNWWLPRWLDWLLPRFGIEGEK